MEFQMIFRVLYLIALIGLVGPDSGSDGRTVVPVDEDEQRMGGEGFGNVVALVAVLGVVILAAIVILAILALTGQFENEIIDPPA
jgi:hypothetical protein